MDFTETFNHMVYSLSWTVLAIQVILHFIFAAAVARDSGRLVKAGRTTWLVSGVTWAFATLIGGVFIAAIYWFMHYSNLARPIAK